MDKPELKESVCCNLRSVTQSCKGGVPLNRLERDYRDLIGSQIPFRELGFNSLDNFIRSIPSVICLSKGRDGFLMAEAVADQSTAHIASLISRQKQSTKVISKKPKRFSHNRGGYVPRYASRGERNYSSSYAGAKSSGRSYRQDVKTSPAYHSKPSQSDLPPPNFKIEVKNTNNIPVEKPSTHSVADRPKTKSALVIRGYEVAPRFQRLQQRKVEAGSVKPSASSSSSSTPSTPPRTPTPNNPNPYAFTASSIASAHSSTTSPTEEDLFPPTAPQPMRATQGGSNGFHNVKQRSPLQLRARLNVATLSQQLDSAESAKEYVAIYATMNNLPMSYSTKTIGQKKKGFVTVLVLGENKHLSYPEVAPTPNEAEEIAAAKAVKKIKESEVLPETPISNSEEIQILLNRIEELVCEKPSGMFNNGLQLEYEHHYNERLPSCWIQLLQQSSIVVVDAVEGIIQSSYGKVPDHANFIIRPRHFSSGSNTPSEASGKACPELPDDSDLPNKDDSGDLSNQDTLNILNPAVPPLVIPDGNEWGVYITGIFAADASFLIAARLVDSDEEFLVMLRKMSSYYDTKIDQIDVVEEGCLYATIEGRVDEVLVMHRVLACKVHDNDLVECYFVDEGTMDTVRKSDLQHLHSDFLELPYQAIHFALDDLEEYLPFIIPEHFETLKYKTFIAVVKRWCCESYFPNDPAIHQVTYSVVLYDTSDTKVDICLNDSIKKIVLESLVCKLPKLNVSSPGYLTHVTSTGQIYIRFLHPTKSWLELELGGLSALFQEACAENNFSPSGSIFAAKCDIDDKWYRAVIPEKPNIPNDPNLLEVIFVDYGYPFFVKKNEICDLQDFSEFLCSLPYQAVKCELHNALPSPSSKWTLSASQQLIELAPFGEELIIKVFSEKSEALLPKISLHKRFYSKEDSVIVSINEHLACQPALFLDSSAVPSNGSVRAPTKLNLQQKSAQLPLKGTAYNSPFESSVENIMSPLKNLDVTSQEGIQWATTPDMVKSPEDEDVSPPPIVQPQVPEEKQMFDVFVTTAANPHNFIVQPLKYAKEMNDLMIQMQQFYCIEENLIEMHPSLLQRNSFYAALHSDNEWYRVRLVSFNPSEPDEALVYYVDFGDYDKVYLQNLQKLYNQFRVLPCQAIKASLSGVRPIDIDWNPEHCVAFKGMVTEKKFVSIVEKKQMTQEQGFPSLELEVTLIDTTDPKLDVYIHELLIKNSMALKAAV